MPDADKIAKLRAVLDDPNWEAPPHDHTFEALLIVYAGLGSIFAVIAGLILFGEI